MSRRLSVVDLTSAQASSDHRSSTSSPPDQPSTLDRAGSQTTPRGIKRRRENDGFWSPNSSDSSEEVEQEEEAIESIDLTEPETSLQKALAKQQEDAIKAQQSAEGERSGSVLSAYKCPVCMDTPEDATSTACGHLFCHRCIVEYLNSADQRLDSSKQTRGTCPICRKVITKVDKSGPKRSLIPLELKLTTKKRSLVPPSQA
ncbi:uncharacterized protein N7498_000852 [Penicillium cinerascens]|uniref:RING-type domain-containing protein n=1 Tax=Penicillium cinerascens TaxID=70096 RepID=A0A9W9NHL3_9EURO|nr:uncharacterized protein N7498_000852 [Penicillium cinerascens]KAJ5218753.1 hypothetical protein N7498_000852 [Penicillium cinerascens]